MRSTPHLSSPKAAATLLGFALAFLFICATISPASAQCVASFREIKFPDGSARVKNYVCKSEGSAKPDIRVEFDRLSEAAAGNLIEGEPYPELDKAFGKVRLVNNAVAVETKKLFDDFGVKKSRGDLLRVSSRVGHRRQGLCEQRRQQLRETGDVVHHLSRPRGPDHTQLSAARRQSSITRRTATGRTATASSTRAANIATARPR